MRAFVVIVVAAVMPPTALASDVVGPEACRACHPVAYEIWRASPHARAKESLTGRHKDDPRCLTCHAPQADLGVAGVTCETCHGAGRLYAARYVMRDPELARAVGLLDPSEKTCLSCHTDTTPSLVGFDYSRKLVAMKHWGDAVAPPPAKPSR